MIDAIRIVKTGHPGNSIGTKVYLSSGEEITKVVSVKLSTFACDQVLTAEITVLVAECDITAHPLLALESLMDAAKAHGFTLIAAGVGGEGAPMDRSAAISVTGKVRHFTG